MSRSIMSGARVGLLSGATALSLLAGCTTAGSETTPPPVAGSPAADHFGPDGFGELELDMTEQQALATGDLGAAPVTLDGRCRDYSYADGPAPDVKRMAADAKLQKQLQAAEKAADKAERAADRKVRKNASAQEYADSAQRYADSATASSRAVELSAEWTERAAARTAAFTRAGGASFADGRLRVLVAPPKATTAAGITRGSSLAQLQAAYPGITSTSEGRYDLPVPERAGWKMAFDLSADKVTYFLLLNATLRCR